MLSSARTHTARALLTRVHVVLLTSMVHAQPPEPAVFSAPQGHDISRYERTLGTNPFTLQTAPQPAIVGDFAKDMTLGACFGDRDDPTVVLVNMKTQERHRLKKGDTSPAGFLVENILLGARRSECQVEIRSAAGQVARLTFDEPYLRQLAGQTQPPRTAQPPVPPRAMPPTTRPTTPPLASATTAAARSARTGNHQHAVPFVPEVPPGLRGILPSAAFAAGEEQQAPGSPEEPGQPGSEVIANGPQPVSMPIRRRVITAVQGF